MILPILGPNFALVKKSGSLCQESKIQSSCPKQELFWQRNRNLCMTIFRTRPTAIASLNHDWLKSCTMMMRRGKTTKYISKSTFDLTDGKRTKSREKLAEKVIGAGLRKTLSKSREQLWRSKVSQSHHFCRIIRRVYCK